MSTTARRFPFGRPSPSRLIAGSLVLVATLLVGCGSATSSARPSGSLLTLQFTPLPTAEQPSAVASSASRTPARSALTASWPVGWDVSFCTAFADLTVAHQLLIDIERALADESPTDAQGLSNELAQTAPIASNEVTHLKDWDPATEVKTSLAAMLDLDTQAAAAYQSYFNDSVKAGLHDARQLRNQVSKQVASINQQLQSLADLGVSCPGTSLALETF